MYMIKKVIITVVVLAGIVGLGLAAHMLNLIGIIKRMHGI